MKKNIMESKNQEDIWKRMLFIIAFVVFSLSLIEIFHTPYTGDDRINSLTKGSLEYYGNKLPEYTFWGLRMWTEGGRFFPLGFYSYALFTWLPDLFLYRIFLFILNHIVAIVFTALAYQISKKWSVACFSLCLTSIFFQFRDLTGDGILGFHGLIQFVAIFAFLSLLFQLKAMEKGRKFFYVCSSFFCLLSLLLYEISYAFIISYLLAAFFYKKGRDRVISLLPQLIAFAVAMIPTLYFRANAQNRSYDGILFSLAPFNIVRTFLIQFSSAFPLSFLWPIREDFLEDMNRFPQMIKPYQVLLCLLSMIGICLSVYIFQKNKGDEACAEAEPDENSKWKRNLLLLGLAIGIAPAAMLSVSLKYQNLLRWGVGYLPVYIQYYGMIFVCSSLFFMILEKLKKKKYKNFFLSFFSVCFTVVLFFTIVGRQIIVRRSSDIQPLSQLAMEKGLLDEMPENASFLMMQGGFGAEVEPQSFVHLHTDGQRTVPLDMKLLASENESEADENGLKKIYPEDAYVFFAEGNMMNGVACLGEIYSIDYHEDSGRAEQVSVKKMKGFYVGDAPNILLSIPRFDLDGTLYFERVLTNDLKSLERTENLEEKGSLIPPASESIWYSRISDTIKPTIFEKFCLPPRGDSFFFLVDAEDNPILLRGITLVSQN